MKRREFFKLGFQKTIAVVVEETETHVEHRARQWIRPPFAIKELDFLLKCTRCGDCIRACPYDVLFPLPANFGLEVVSTPAMDLTAKGCRLCHDWPCVAACKPAALFLSVADIAAESSEDENSALPLKPVIPKLADVHIIENRCLPYSGPECGACAHSCPVEGALLWDGPKPHINQQLCNGCAMCVEACITDPRAIGVRSVTSA